MDGYLAGAKDISLTKQDVEFILTQVHKAKEKIRVADLDSENIILMYLNNIGAKLTNR